MLVYLSATFFSILMAYLHKRSKKNKYFFVILSFLPLFLVSGLRKFVGTDYMHYLYNKTPAILSGNGTEEFGYQLLTLFCMNVLGNYQWIIVFLSFVTCACFFKSFYRYSNDMVISICVFVATGCYYFSLNGMRQSLAIAIFFFAIKYIETKNFKFYLLNIFFACCFHISAIVYIPLYFLLNHKISYKTIISVSFFLYIIWPPIAYNIYKIILGDYIGYFDWGSISGFNWRFLLPLLLILFLDYSKKTYNQIRKLPSNAPINIFRNLFIFSFWACNLAPTLTGAVSARVIYFFLPSIAIYLPFLLKLYKHRCLPESVGNIVQQKRNTSISFNKLENSKLHGLGGTLLLLKKQINNFVTNWNPKIKIKQIIYVICIIMFIWISEQNGGWILPYHSIFSNYTMNYDEFMDRIYENREF
jgi:hypothetical protein